MGGGRLLGGTPLGGGTNAGAVSWPDYIQNWHANVMVGENADHDDSTPDYTVNSTIAGTLGTASKIEAIKAYYEVADGRR